jgi:N-acetylglucosamine kinase-like BadF-type ATPase
MGLGLSNPAGNDKCLDACIRHNYLGASAPGRSRRLHAAAEGRSQGLELSLMGQIYVGNAGQFATGADNGAVGKLGTGSAIFSSTNGDIHKCSR